MRANAAARNPARPPCAAGVRAPTEHRRGAAVSARRPSRPDAPAPEASPEAVATAARARRRSWSQPPRGRPPSPRSSCRSAAGAVPTAQLRHRPRRRSSHRFVPDARRQRWAGGGLVSSPDDPTVGPGRRARIRSSAHDPHQRRPVVPATHSDFFGSLLVGYARAWPPSISRWAPGASASASCRKALRSAGHARSRRSPPVPACRPGARFYTHSRFGLSAAPITARTHLGGHRSQDWSVGERARAEGRLG